VPSCIDIFDEVDRGRLLRLHLLEDGLEGFATLRRCENPSCDLTGLLIKMVRKESRKKETVD
jgi:hypothetical protein